VVCFLEVVVFDVVFFEVVTFVVVCFELFVVSGAVVSVDISVSSEVAASVRPVVALVASEEDFFEPQETNVSMDSASSRKKAAAEMRLVFFISLPPLKSVICSNYTLFPRTFQGL